MHFKIIIKSLLMMSVLMVLSHQAIAEDRVQPFVLAYSGAGEISQQVEQTQQKLGAAGFEVIGNYSPYAQTQILVFTSEALKQIALKSERGGYGAALRVALTKNGDNLEISYTNPKYWANAYRMADNLDQVSAKLENALGKIKEYGTGDKKLSAEDMRDYHYTFMMEYFDDPSKLNKFSDHDKAVEEVNKYLKAGAGHSEKVYQLDLGKDSEGKRMTLFGVALRGRNTEDCSGDQYIMSRIDKSTPRHSAHLPYEMLVYGNKVEALYARFRIAISWPHLPMMSSPTGATFFNIMCAPDSIESALRKVAGGKDDDDF